MGLIRLDQTLFLLVLRGTDDYTGHAVCLIRGLVFDAPEKSGVIFNRRNLDLCCGDGAVVKFHSVFRSYRGVHEHIEKGKSDFKFDDPVLITARLPCINNRMTTLVY
jgi:hypothetical protein